MFVFRSTSLAAGQFHRPAAKLVERLFFGFFAILIPELLLPLSFSLSFQLR